MKTPEQLKADMEHFTGTCRYYKYSPLFPKVLLTEGSKFLAEEAGAYWLMDVVASHLPKMDDGFAVAMLKVKNGKATFTLTDDLPANKTYAKQSISFTDFPLDEIKLYVGFDGEYYVILLASEY